MRRAATALLPRLALSAAALLVTAPLAAEEGMWLPNDFPQAKVAKLYGFELQPSELEHLQLAAVRVGFGGSGSFVSADGLVLTNHHVARDCIQKLSSPQRDLIAHGFVAATREAELTCPDTDVHQLLGITSVTERVQAAAAHGKDDAEASRLRRAEIAAIELGCAQPPTVRCDVVTLFGGARYDLYRYRRYTDVRLAFAPEADLAHFGGDPDNFDFPRYCLDFSLLRVYDQGKPVRPVHWLKWSKTPLAEGDFTLVAGHPGSTKRNATVAQLRFFRDQLQPAQQAWRDQIRSQLEAYALRGPEQARQVGDFIQAATNSLKAIAGAQSGLLDPELMAAKEKEEGDLRAALAARPELQAKFGDPWKEIETAYETNRDLDAPYRLLETEFAAPGRLLGITRGLVRLGFESTRPDGERLPDYREAGRPVLERRLFSSAPIYPELEEAVLSNYLWRLRSQLGPIHPLILATMGRRPPEELAHEWIQGTKLFDVEARKALVAGGKDAVLAATDPLVKLFVALEPTARELRRRFDEEVDAVEISAGSRLAQLKLALAGPGTYPDASSSLRFSFGRVLSYEEAGAHQPWKTVFRGMFERAELHGRKDPWSLTPAIDAARSKLDLDGAVDFASTNDTTGGNSGSPVVNRRLEVVGVLFDGNLFTLPNRYLFSDQQSRSLSVDAGAMIQTLRTVYPASHLAGELLGEGRP